MGVQKAAILTFQMLDLKTGRRTLIYNSCTQRTCHSLLCNCNCAKYIQRKLVRQGGVKHLNQGNGVIDVKDIIENIQIEKQSWKQEIVKLLFCHLYHINHTFDKQ